MSLKTTVKVGNITNLSDARYAAGMGADMLGFSVIPGQSNYIDTTLFQQIRGWVTGPKIVVELYGIDKTTDIGKLIEDHVPDYVEMTLDEYKQYGHLISFPAIVKIESDNLTSIPEDVRDVNFWLVDQSMADRLPGHLQSFMVNVASKELLDSLLNNKMVGAVALSGSKELRPGFKDYDELAEILEALED